MEQAQPHHPATTNGHGAWPGAFGAYKPSAETVKRNLNAFLLIWALGIVGGALIGALFGHRSVFGQLLSSLLSTFINAGVIITVMASLRSKRVEFAEVAKQAWPVFLPLFVLQVLVVLSIFFGLVLLIIPGLIILPRLALASYFLVDKKLGIMESYQASWNATKGHSGKVWGIIGVTILMVLPVFTIIGVILTVYWLFLYQAVLGLLYVHLTKK